MKVLKILVAETLVSCLFGCQIVDKLTTSRSPSEESEAIYLRQIATQLGLHVPSDRRSADIATDIRIYLDESILRPPEGPTDELVRQLSGIAKPEEVKSLSESRDFLRKLKGHRILLLPTR